MAASKNAFLPAGRRARNIFDPASADPYPLSRSKIELFLECPRCFYLDRRLGIGRVDGPPFTLNLAVDHLMKKEFDFFRARNEPHPAMSLHGIDAVPFRHKDLETWRDTPTGLRTLHGESNFEVFGLLDDVWQMHDGSLAAVDYKATSTDMAITLDNRAGYKRQIDVYQWLLRANGFTTLNIGYFVFVNAARDRDMFDRTLEFSLSILPYEGNDGWVNDALVGAHECLMSDVPSPSTIECEWCAYRKAANEAEK